MKKFIMNLKIVGIILAILLLIIGAFYIDYTIYIHKYPNTSLWMYLLDSSK